jgi:energy-coupling factor transporter ATP-binding protein EcfA2
MQVLSRQDFVENYFSYRPGEHVNVIGPTGTGKTHLISQLLGSVKADYPSLQATWLVPKPDDPPMYAIADRLGFRITDDWPPRQKFWQGPAQDHMLWPKHIIDDDDANKAHLHKVFGKCFDHHYVAHGNILVADDTYLLGCIYDLNDKLDRHWIAGRSGGSGLWSALQKPSGTKGKAVSSFAYDAPTHLFFGRDNDDRNLERIGELGISTISPKDTQAIVRGLNIHRINGENISDLLYINRSGPYMAIVRPF